MSDLIFSLHNEAYHYDKETKKLVIGSGEEKIIADVLELTETKLKLAAPVMTRQGLGYIIFVFKQK